MTKEEKQKLEIYVNDYCKLSHAMPLIHALEGGVLDTDSFIAGFVQFLDNRNIITVTINKE